MTDYTELKRLAEAFPSDLDWDSNTEPFFNGPSGESLGGGSTGFYCVYGAAFEIDGEQYDGHTYVETCKVDFAKFMVAARDGVLALIAENERLHADCSSMRGSLKAYALTIKKLIKDGSRASRERDQLRAENAGLQTGYKAYEQVNAELKAEVDSLTREADRQYTTIEAYRHDAERYRWLLENASIILDKKTAYQAETGFIKLDTMPGRTETESAIDAAMGHGEQP